MNGNYIKKGGAKCFIFPPLSSVLFKRSSWIQQYKFVESEALMGNYILALAGLLLAIHPLSYTGNTLCDWLLDTALIFSLLEHKLTIAMQ